METDGSKQVVTVRLAGFELYALDQFAALNGMSRSDAFRHGIVDAMRHMMLEHPVWPMHPAWVNPERGQSKWVIALFQKWAWAIVAPDPTEQFDRVSLDGVTAFRLKANRAAPKVADWQLNLDRYLGEQEASR
jgi:hypothetical protein